MFCTIFSNYDKQHECQRTNKSCSEAITAFLSREKHLINEHRADTDDQRVEAERNPQREIFTLTE